MPRIGHVIDEFLRLSETFVYTQLRHQPQDQIAIFARRRVNGDRFPLHPVHELDPRSEPRYVAAVTRRFHEATRLPTRFERALVDAARREGCGLLHAHFGWSGREAVLAARQLSLPLLTAMHGRDVYAPRRGRGDTASYYRRLFATGTRFTCVGPNAERELIRLGCPPDRLRIVKVGVDLEAFAYRASARREPFVVLQVARLAAKKGVDTTLRGFAQARSRLGRSELWLVGDGPERRALERLAGELGVAGDVRFLGALPHDEVRRRMERADVGVQPSRVAPDGDREGTPTVLIEMQALGIPVIATRHADIPSIVAHPDELIAEGDDAALARALLRLATLPEPELEQRRRAGRALVEQQHDARRIAAQLEALYAEMLDERAA